ncbi:hypothetical protein XENTR_v10018528 [Xenopus tropicalis]|nr:hypothetical protein XENTR_v10018528 [Xenopus tropicalis]KAE8591652.1 hypothetical protein XENTR_v10018528 [Xenopus tropicalis]
MCSKEQKSSAQLGWLCFQALREETVQREAVELELQAVKDQLAIMRECLRSSLAHNEELEIEFTKYVVKTMSNNHHRKETEQEENAALVRVRALVSKGDRGELAQWSGAHEEVQEDMIRPIVTTRQVSQSAGIVDRSSGNTEAADQQYIEQPSLSAAVVKLGQPISQVGGESGVLTDPITSVLPNPHTVKEEWERPDKVPFTAHMKNTLLVGSPTHLKAPLLHKTDILLGRLECAEENIPKQRVVKVWGTKRLKNSRRQMFLDLLQYGVPKPEIDGIPTADLLKRSQKVSLKLPQPQNAATCNVEDLSFLLSHT